MAAARDDDDGEDDDIPERAVAVGRPLPRCRTQPRSPAAAADDDDDGDAAAAAAAAAAAVAAAAVDAAAAVVAVALAQCPRTPAARPRRPPAWHRAPDLRRRRQRRRAPPRTDCHCCAGGARTPRADSRARNCCARSCVRGASRAPASFQPVPSPVVVAVPIHVILVPNLARTADSRAFVDDDAVENVEHTYMSRRR